MAARDSTSCCARRRRRPPPKPAAPKPAAAASALSDPPPPPPKAAAPSRRRPPHRQANIQIGAASAAEEKVAAIDNRSDEYYRTKTEVFNALIDTIDLSQLAQLDQESAREEIRDIVIEIVSIKNVVMSVAEQETLLEDICNDVLGYGPLEPLLAATTSPTSWSTVRARPTSRSPARSSAPTSASATTRS